MHRGLFAEDAREGRLHRFKIEKRLVDIKDNQGKNGHVVGLLFVTLGLDFLSLSVLALEPAAMRGLFGAVATNRHAAPSSRPPPRMVREDQRAAMTRSEGFKRPSKQRRLVIKSN
jgi:hypothetical protein